MPTDPSNFDPSTLPPGLSADDLADLVEGTVRAEREAEVLAALRAEPRLAVLVKSLRVDASSLRGLDEGVRAPESLAAAIEQRLEAGSLAEVVGLGALNTPAAGLGSSTTLETGGVPRPRIVEASVSPLRALVDSVWFRRLATAASIALLAGVGVVVVRQFSSVGPSGGPSGGGGFVPTPRFEVAENAPANVPGVVDAPTVTLAAGEPVGPPMPEVLADSSSSPPVVPEVASGPVGPEATVAAASRVVEPEPLRPVVILPSVPLEPMLTSREAAALAEQGRLVITVSAPRPDSVLRRLEGLARALPRERAVTSIAMNSVPAEYLALTRPAVLPKVARLAPRPTPTIEPSDLAGDQPDGGLPRPMRPIGLESQGSDGPTPYIRAIYTARVAPSEDELADLVRQLTDFRGTVAGFRALEAPIAAPMALDPEAVLWWGSNPARWVRRVTVPIVVESLE
jgi:hypothetical protein